MTGRGLCAAFFGASPAASLNRTGRASHDATRPTARRVL